MIFDKKVVIIFLIIAVVVSLGLTVFLYYFNSQKQLELNFLDVGQGDAILIKTPYGQNILIDGGDGKKILPELSRVLPFYDRTLDLMILTHPHDDHAGGLVKVLKRYRTQKILYTGVVHTSPVYLEWLNIIKRKNIPLTIIDRPQTITLGADLRLQILYPVESLLNQEMENLNNSSIIIKLIYQNEKFLLVGDAETEVENDLAPDPSPYKGEGSYFNLQSNVLKIGHHGSDTSSSENFLAAVKPKIAIIQVGKDNDFGHPSLRVINRLERLGAKIYRTDLNGWIDVVSDGKTIDIHSSR
ncbi:MAG: MBL fold metallo-hydrolase [Methanoregula sp.]|jgi:competence protein ComEC|nr:MBL fold metallo-hydrolase [Methanoregula sp.]